MPVGQKPIFFILGFKRKQKNFSCLLYFFISWWHINFNSSGRKILQVLNQKAIIIFTILIDVIVDLLVIFRILAIFKRAKEREGLFWIESVVKVGFCFSKKFTEISGDVIAEGVARCGWVFIKSVLQIIYNFSFSLGCQWSNLLLLFLIKLAYWASAISQNLYEVQS